MQYVLLYVVHICNTHVIYILYIHIILYYIYTYVMYSVCEEFLINIHKYCQ